MPDVTIIGGGEAARSADRLLTEAGFSIHHAFQVDPHERNPAILGESGGAFALARQLIDAGRPLLIAAPQSVTAGQLSALLGSRRARQPLFVWSERRYHAGYRLVRGLAEADASTWWPRLIRHTYLSMEAPSAALSRWCALESTALVLQLSRAAALTVSAVASENESRNATDFLALHLQMENSAAYIQTGLGEPFDRRETVIAATGRKAWIDEVSESVPVRFLSDEDGSASTTARQVFCPAPATGELARQQCLAFLEASHRPALAEEEADLWSRSLAVLRAAEASLSEDGSPVEVSEANGQAFRLILGGQTPRLRRSAG